MNGDVGLRGVGPRSGSRRRGTGRGMNRGGMIPTAPGRIPAPPQTPLDNVFAFPFPRLLRMNERGTMTLDEELLRAIISMFTLPCASFILFHRIYEQLEEQNPTLLDGLYKSKEHLWSYIRCYPEQFAIDMDPVEPWNIMYVAKCKIVAKSDRGRYRREYYAGNIRIDPDPEIMWNAVPYDLDKEKEACLYLLALFNQIQHLLSRDSMAIVDVKLMINAFLPMHGVPEHICDYVGAVDDFMRRRTYVFIIFGHTVSICHPLYVQVIRAMTKYLAEHGKVSSLQDLYDFFRSSPEIGQEGLRVVLHEEQVTPKDFMNLLHAHKLVFRLCPREHDGRVYLRHDVVPDLTDADIASIPPFRKLDEAITREELGGQVQNEISASAGCIGRPPDQFDDYDDYFDGDDDADEGEQSGMGTSATAQALIPGAATGYTNGFGSASASPVPTAFAQTIGASDSRQNLISDRRSGGFGAGETLASFQAYPSNGNQSTSFASVNNTHSAFTTMTNEPVAISARMNTIRAPTVPEAARYPNAVGYQQTTARFQAFSSNANHNTAMANVNANVAPAMAMSGLDFNSYEYTSHAPALAAANGDDPMPQRPVVIRFGARPPRCSVRARRLQETGRDSMLYGYYANGNANIGAFNGHSSYEGLSRVTAEMLENEIEDIDD